MYGLNIDPNNPRGNPAASELQALGVQMVRYTFYDTSGGDQVDPDRVRFYQDRAGAYAQVGIRSLVILTLLTSVYTLFRSSSAFGSAGSALRTASPRTPLPDATRSTPNPGPAVLYASAQPCYMLSISLR